MSRQEAQHCTIARYTSKKWRCRCRLCQTAWASYMRDYMQERRAKVAK